MVLHGEPKIEEPLRVAREGMQRKLDKEFAAAAEECFRAYGEKVHPTLKPHIYPNLMFNALHGTDDNLKFERIFSKARVWLLKFTGIEWDAKLLGFKLSQRQH